MIFVSGRHLRIGEKPLTTVQYFHYSLIGEPIGPGIAFMSGFQKLLSRPICGKNKFDSYRTIKYMNGPAVKPNAEILCHATRFGTGIHSPKMSWSGR
jgi:hypothetical protein